MDRESYALDQLTWDEAAAILRRDPRLLIPTGSFEQSAPRVPLGANTYIARRLARDLSSELGILLAPALAYGVARGIFPGATGLIRKTFHRCVNELLAGWEEHGFEEFVLLTAHHHDPHVDALLMALTSKATTTVIDLGLIDVRDLLEGGPAQETEEILTSLLLHLSPELVRRDTEARSSETGSTPGERYTAPRDRTPGLGPLPASAAKGEEIYLRYRAAVRAALER